MAITGIYEELITRVLQEKLEQQRSEYFIESQPLDPEEASLRISRFLGEILRNVMESFPQTDDRVSRQIEFANTLLKWLQGYIATSDFSENVIDIQGRILTGLFHRNNPVAADLKAYVKRITPTVKDMAESFRSRASGALRAAAATLLPFLLQD